MKYLHRLILVALLVVIPVMNIAGQDDQTIADTLSALADADEFTLLLQALEKADLLDTLDGDSVMTLFAPTDDAFQALFEELEMSRKEVMAAGDALKEILLYHVADGEMTLDDMLDAGEVPSLLPDAPPITVAAEDGEVLLDGFAFIVGEPIPASNGIIFVVDAVLLPLTKDQGGAACTVSTSAKNSVAVRVGPGENRTSVTFLPANQEFEVLGQAIDNGGSVWFKLDPAEAAAGRAINEAWVAADDLDQTGDCDSVNEAAAPPIIPITSARPNPPGGGEDSGGSQNSEPGAVPQAGRWTMVLNPTSNASCTNVGNVAFSTSEIFKNNTFTFQVQVSNSTITMDGDTFYAVGGGTYTGKWNLGDGSYATVTLRVISANVITGELVISWDNCSGTTGFTLTR